MLSLGGAACHYREVQQNGPLWTTGCVMDNRPEFAIEARDIWKTYRAKSGDQPALWGIDLAVPEGSIFGLLGPNGAGKSTFINILAGQVVKDSGSVRIWGYDQDRNPRMTRSLIGVVPQELNIDPYFTPRECLEFQAGLFAVAHADRRVKEILEAVGLAEQGNSYARALSGGMRRRLLLAKAMVHNPPVLVLDEPTAGVDVELRSHLWQMVRERNAAGATVILTTHYLEEAEEMCDTIAIIDRGSVVACSDKSALLRRIDVKTLTITPTERVDGLPEAVARPARGAMASLRGDGAISVTYSPKSVTAGEILARLTAAGIGVLDITTDEPDLKEVFLAITGAGVGAGGAEPLGGEKGVDLRYNDVLAGKEAGPHRSS